MVSSDNVSMVSYCKLTRKDEDINNQATIKADHHVGGLVSCMGNICHIFHDTKDRLSLDESVK